MAKNLNKNFEKQTITLDGNVFENCTFTGCEMVYGGGDLPGLNGCHFQNCSWAFKEEAAVTLSFLSGMYKGGFSDLVEDTFHMVRKGQFIATSDAANQVEESSTNVKEKRHPLTYRVPKIFRISKSDN
ncbi:MAG: hypothetical protein AAF478_07225 [Pseudomonadota bacterium]